MSSSSFSSSSSHSHSSSSSSPAGKPKKPLKPKYKTPAPKCSKVKIAKTSDGGCETAKDSSNSPVRYFNGEVILSMTDVAGGLSGFGHTRSYSNQLDTQTEAVYEGPNGNNWLIPGWPYLIQETPGSNDVLVYVSGQGRLWFDRDSGAATYTARYGGDVSDALVEDSGANTFTLTTNSGGGVSTAVFHDFTASALHPEGFVKESTDAYGKTTTVHSYKGESIEEVRRTEGSDLWSLVYTFYGTGNHTDRIETATIRKSDDSGSTWTDIRRASYSYHTGGTTYGSRNDLETVTVQFPESGGTWGDASKTYYRWYKSGDSKGFEGGLRYVVGPAAYAEMLADGLTPETASNTQVEGVADHFFEYDSTTREVTKEVATDCAGCGGGGGTGNAGETFARTEATHSGGDGYNSWKWKVVLTKANGNIETVYTNYLGQVMLKELKESTSSSRKWITYSEYGTSGGSVAKVVKSATPAAVSGYNDTNADLGVTLRSDAGLISYSTYYDATDILNGEALGYLQKTEISEGTAGTKIKQQVIEYTESGTSDPKTYVPSKTTKYRDDAGTEAIETTYAYEWYSGGSVPGAGMKQTTTTLPAIPASQNGDGTSATTRQFYDNESRMTFSQDERGIVTKNTYDAATGRMTKRQVDVAQSEAGMPSGWTVGGTTPHEDVTTEYEYDDLGRQVQVLGQAHEANPGGTTAEEIRHATWTVYQEGVSSDQTWTGRGYHRVVAGADELINPVSISFTDKNGRPIDQIQSKRSTGSGKLSATDTFLRADWSRWSTSIYSTVGLLEYTRAYHAIPAQSPDLGISGVTSDPGTSGANYEETHYGYDLETNLRVRTLTPGGTVSRTVYDAINRLSSSWIGTDDGGANWDTWDPDSPGTNMKKVSERQYDSGNAGGNSQLTRSTQHADDNTTREINFTYDFRGRQTSTTDPIGRVAQPIYNNLGQTTKAEQYDGDPAGSGTLIGKSESFFDDRGRVYETKSYAVDPDTGTVGNALTGENWYDAAGAVTKSIAPGSGVVFSKNTYDNLGRQISGYTAYESGGSDVIVAEGETTFNKVSQTLYSMTKQRDTDTPSGSPAFRTSYSANWYDGAGRGIASANYGTNGDSSFTRPDTVPVRSDTILVNSTAYNDAGEAYSVTDPKDIENRQVFDDMGRITEQIDNYQASGSGTDINRTTEYTYTADSQQATVTAKMTASANDEVTTYVYGVTTSGGSGINANNVLAAIQYPEDTATKRIDLKVNRLGQLIEREDQNGTVHQIAYDGLGRPTSDAVTTVGTGVDDAIRRFTTSYTTRGQAQALTSYSETANSVPGNAAINQVEFEYNDFGQLVSDWQEHDGEVVTSGGGISKRVQYGFNDGSGGSNQIRPQSMTYPDGRQLDYSYGTSGSGYDLFNQVHAIKDGSTDLVEYKYLGGGQPVVADYTEPNIKLDLWGGIAGTYDGLDDFGRVVDQPWINYAGSPVDVARFEYGYDRDSIVSYRRDTVAHALSKGFDELYTRDGLNRLNDFQRGLLNTGNTAIPPVDLDFQQDWDLDQVANWTGFNQDDNGDGTDNFVQTRTHNKVNEITAITNTTGGPSGGWEQSAYDDAGNMTTLPKPESPADGFTAKYDAWNRLVSLSDEATGTKVAEYQYDPRGFRIRKEMHTAGVLTSTIDCYYTSGWQCIEEIETTIGGSSSSSSSGTTTTTTQYVYGLRYIDDTVCRDRTPQGGSTDRLYVLSDRQFNTVAITDSIGNVLERIAYTPYGDPEFLNEDFTIKSNTGYGWTNLFQGLFRDPITGLTDNRARELHPLLGRFLQRDPLGYPDGLNTYAAYHVMWAQGDAGGLSLRDLNHGDGTWGCGNRGYKKPFYVEEPGDTWNDSCPQLFRCLRSLMSELTNEGIAVLGVINNIQKLLIETRVVIAAYDLVNDGNADASLLELLWGNGNALQPGAAVLGMTLQTPRITHIVNNSRLRIPGETGFTAMSPAQKAALRRLGKVSVYGVIANFAIHGALDVWEIHATADALENLIEGEGDLIDFMGSMGEIYQIIGDEFGSTLDAKNFYDGKPFSCEDLEECDAVTARCRANLAHVRRRSPNTHADMNAANNMIDDARDTTMEMVAPS